VKLGARLRDPFGGGHRFIELALARQHRDEVFVEIGFEVAASARLSSGTSASCASR
jgi:hypothetical protein